MLYLCFVLISRWYFPLSPPILSPSVHSFSLLLHSRDDPSDSSRLDLDIFGLASAPEREKSKSDAAGTTSGIAMETEDCDETDGDGEPLFFQPGKRGFYSPRPGKNSSERLNVFRNVGRWGSAPLCEITYHDDAPLSTLFTLIPWCTATYT